MYYVYIIELCDDSYYTGITKDINRRMLEHTQGKGSKYVWSRLPIKRIVYTEEVKNKSLALKREATIKKMSRKSKEKLVINSRINQITQLIKEHEEKIEEKTQLLRTLMRRIPRGILW